MMPNKLKMISSCILFKEKLRSLISEEEPGPDKDITWKILIMTEIAHRSFELGCNIEENDKNYFEGYSFVARNYRDWGLGWVADFYYEISNCIQKCYWPGSDNVDLEELEIFKLFDLSLHAGDE